MIKSASNANKIWNFAAAVLAAVFYVCPTWTLSLNGFHMEFCKAMDEVVKRVHIFSISEKSG